MHSNISYRQLTENEKKIMDRLLYPEFPGKNEVIKQLEGCKVRSIDENNSLVFLVSKKIKAPVTRRIPIEAEVEDKDGVIIHILLHVVDGIVTELEIYKEDSSSVTAFPDSAGLRLVQLEN